MVEVTLIGNLTADVIVRDGEGGEKYYKTAERYAKKIEEERNAVAAANANIVDPWDAVFFTST